MMAASAGQAHRETSKYFVLEFDKIMHAKCVAPVLADENDQQLVSETEQGKIAASRVPACYRYVLLPTTAFHQWALKGTIKHLS